MKEIVLHTPDLAGPYGILRTILIIIVIFYAFRLVMRLVGPWILKKGVENMTRKAEEQMREEQARRTGSREPEGTITIEKKQKKGGRSDDDEGEYVDFEEVK